MGAVDDPTDLALEGIFGLGSELDSLSTDELISIPRTDDLKFKAAAHQNKSGNEKETHSPSSEFYPDE